MDTDDFINAMLLPGRPGALKVGGAPGALHTIMMSDQVSYVLMGYGGAKRGRARMIRMCRHG